MKEHETDGDGSAGAVLPEHITARNRQIEVGERQCDLIDDLGILGAAADVDRELTPRQPVDGLDRAAEVESVMADARPVLARTGWVESSRCLVRELEKAVAT